MTDKSDGAAQLSDVRSVFGAAGIVFALAMASACGTPTQLLGITDVSPHVGTATQGTSQNTVQFTATGIYGDPYGYGSCCFDSRTVTDGKWTTSDSGNIAITKSGLATCEGVTSTPATIMVTVNDDYGNFSGSAKLVCQ